jgi:hypothetical protein
LEHPQPAVVGIALAGRLDHDAAPGVTLMSTESSPERHALSANAGSRPTTVVLPLIEQKGDITDFR